MKGAITAMKNIDYDGYLGPRMTRDVQRKRLQHVMENELTELQRLIQYERTSYPRFPVAVMPIHPFPL